MQLRSISKLKNLSKKKKSLVFYCVRKYFFSNFDDLFNFFAYISFFFSLITIPLATL